MRLTTYTDYALRTLMYLAAHRERLVTIQDIADVHGIAKNHLTKVVHQLGLLGYVESMRGRNGGLRLGMEPAGINIGEVVRSTEPDFYMAECFDPDKSRCIMSSACILKDTLHSATQAYLAVLNGVTLADLMKNEGDGTDSGASFRAIPIRVRVEASASSMPTATEARKSKKTRPQAPAGLPAAAPLPAVPVAVTRSRRPGSR
ncbi:MAG: Rrf2 family transcriptional regulator [Polaromonas sp.]